jgi:hypothetical protein
MVGVDLATYYDGTDDPPVLFGALPPNDYPLTLENRLAQNGKALASIAANTPKNAQGETENYAYFIEYKSERAPLGFDGRYEHELYRDLQDKLPGWKTGAWLVDDYEQAKKYYLRTDIHWNKEGVYRGYESVLDLLGIPDEPIRPAGEITPTVYRGSLVRTAATDIYSEDFCADWYEYSPRKVWIGDTEVEAYGHQREYVEGGNALRTLRAQGGQWSDDYVLYYGDNYQIVRIQIEDPVRDENLLMIGLSHDNAYVNLLASHFRDTYAVDLRYFKGGGRIQESERFGLQQFIDEHDIDKVLFSIESINTFADFDYEG